MGARLRSWQRNLLDSLWFVPAAIAALYIVLALVLVQVDAALGLDSAGSDAWAVGGADGARGVLFAIAGVTLSVLGVAISLTVVVLQIASAQFTPRVMRNLTGDRGTQVVLGVFFGTFTYALLVLRAVRSPGEDGSAGGFVPVTAVAVAVALALLSIAFMVYYIDHVARSVQVAVIIERVTHDTLAQLDEPLADGADEPPADPERWADPAGTGAAVAAAAAGYLQAIDAGALLGAAEAHGLAVRTERPVGVFLLAGAPLATAWPEAAVDEPTADALRAAFVIGAERTRQQDAELGIRQLADIAVRALSPAINDPTTATMCIDRLGQLLVRAAGREEAVVLTGTAGRLLLRGPSFARLADVAFTQIRHYGAGDVLVACHVAATLGAVARRVPPACGEPLRGQVAALLAEAEHALVVAEDRDRLAAAAGWAREAVPVEG